MITNYLKIAIRSLAQHRSYTFINLLGLAIGMTCCMLIALYVQEEFSYNRFHENADRTVAIGVERTGLATPYMLADIMNEGLPEVETATRIHTSSSAIRLGREPNDLIEAGTGVYAEPEFFEIFSFDLLVGNENQVLTAPNQIILTQRVSERLFGNDNPVGETVHWYQTSDQNVERTRVLDVVGVVESPPHNSSIAFDVLISMTTESQETWWQDRPDVWFSVPRTFALLHNTEAMQGLDERLASAVATQLGDESLGVLQAIPIASLHMSEESSSSGFTGNRRYIYLFGSIVVLILLIACVNYINLATARVTLRSKEIGIRKTVGAYRYQIALQFLGESILLSFTAFVIGLFMTEATIPHFNQVFGTNISMTGNLIFVLWLALAAFGVGVLAGIFPALYLSGFSPSSIFRKHLSWGQTDAGFRKILVVTQFTIALVLITGIIVIYEQLQYTQTKDMGFNDDQVVAIDLQRHEAWQQRDAILSAISSRPGIREIASASTIPGNFSAARLVSELDVDSASAGQAETIQYHQVYVDYNFLDLFEIELLAGRNFSDNYPTDPDQAYIINEKAMNQVGWTLEETVGKSLLGGEIIGVIGNIHTASLRTEELVPIMLNLNEIYSSRNLLVRLDPDHIQETLSFIEDEISTLVPGMPFLYEFMDDTFNALYQTERRLAQVTSVFTVIAILIACLGLYGLAAFTAERRTKEIGIRKVMGATVSNIITLLNKDFIKLVLIGFFIAIPVSWYTMNRWLEDFAYKIDIGPGIFLLAGVSVLAIALLTVSWQSIRAAMANPVESLRTE